MKINLLYGCAYHTQKVKMVHSDSAYETRKPFMSKIKTAEHCYPCIMHVSIDNEPSCVWYSDTNQNGMFGVPKVLFGRLTSGVMVDYNGDYGQCQNCSAIVDTVDNLEKIQRAMLSKKFLEMMECVNFGGTNDHYNRKVIGLFKQDFWKDFV